MKMPSRTFLIATSVLFLFSCNTTKQSESKTDTADSSVTKQSTEVKTDMELFSNIEQIEYCLPLPLTEYLESNNGVKAMHTFSHKTKKENRMSVQGLFRDNPSVTIENYFENSVKAAEEEGRKIQQKELLKNNNCFYTKGYWENSFNESRFIEICWLRKDEVITFYSAFDVADTTIWQPRLQTLLAHTSLCK